MKRLTSYLILLFVLSLGISPISAQSSDAVTSEVKELKIGAFKIKKLDFSFGFETDYISDMGYEFFLNHMPAEDRQHLAQLQFADAELHSGTCENPSFNFGITLQHPRLKKLEWRNNIAIKPNRVDAMTYYNHEGTGQEGKYISISGTHHEFTLESAAIWKLPLAKFFNLYGGVGTNLGVTTNNQTCVFTSDYLTAEGISYTNIVRVNDNADSHGGTYSECFDTGSQFNQRAFLQLGWGLKFFQRVELDWAIKTGFGYRVDPGNPADKTHIVSTNIGLRYLLK